MDPYTSGQVVSDIFDAAAAASKCKQQQFFGNIASGITQFFNKPEFFKCLNKIAPRPITTGQAPIRLRDADFVRVSDLCTFYGRAEWSFRPRTFIVLHFMGCPEEIDGLIREGYSDIALPYTAANLPSVIKGDRARRQFLDWQNYVLTTHAESLEKAGQSHQNIEGSADGYFRPVKELGRGSFGQVDHVLGWLSIDNFARKRIPRGKSFKRDKEAIRSFENELKSLKALSHRHLVKLISSYTDRNWVGLIMKPVADCNLDRFLSNDSIDKVDQQTCLRRFFGCLATAVTYLHEKQIRHKDIKPANILIENRRVLLTDFGTSHNWSDDSRSTSSGTSVGFTKRYCAPEVAGYASRNQSSDVWSLGCVFLEIATVLNNRLVDEMRSYFETHGSHGPYVRGNKEAAQAWVGELKQSSKCADDMQPVHLSLHMCEEDPNQRPTAAQVLSEILDFQGVAPYCGHCCDGENGTWTSDCDDAVEVDRQLATATSEESSGHFALLGSPDTFSAPQFQATLLKDTEVTFEENIETLLEKNAPSASVLTDSVNRYEKTVHPARSNWRPPTVEDCEETEKDPTVRYISDSPSPDENCKPDCQQRRSKAKDPHVLPKQRASLPQESPVLVSLKRLDMSRLHCQWPGCSMSITRDVTFDGREELEAHYRDRHLVHEISWSQLLPSKPSTGNQTTGIRVATERNTYKSFVLKTNSTENVELPKSSPIESGKLGHRFSLLPESKRPQPIIQSKTVEDEVQNFDFISPEPLEEPFGPINSESSASNVQGLDQQPRIPNSSMAPSYVLASTNQFTRREMELMLPRTKWQHPPLFVYGSFMFPSILRARAEHFTGVEGVYSEDYQRRLKTDSSDWSKINLSLRHAAEQMTPARLKGYKRFKPHGLNNADVTKSDSGTIVRGFVVCGLSDEAVKCLDYLLSDKQLDTIYGNKYFRDRVCQKNFYRHPVKVDITVQGGINMTIDAVTYHTQTPPSSMDRPWSINAFVRSSAFRKLSGAEEGSVWFEEEKRLASTMGMTLVLPGDALCDALLRNDKDKFFELLDEGHDVRAPCTRFGSILAAAAFQGHEDSVDILIRKGADVNAVGGEFYNPLVAATFQGHEECVRTLLKARANVLAGGGKYISAIHQAVDFNDTNLARLLLDKGAWLTRDYQELMDLAAERGNKAMIRMLEDYDVRKLHQLPESQPDEIKGTDEESGSEHTENSRNRRQIGIRRRQSTAVEKSYPAPSSGAVIKAVAIQALVLKGKKGKWTGIKGVKLLQKALEVGAPESMLDSIAPYHLEVYTYLVDFLGKAIAEHQEEKHGRRKVNSSRSSVDRRGRSRRQESIARRDRDDSAKRIVPGTSRGRSDLATRNSTVDAFCITCDGRGGRLGTGRRCRDCRGAGTLPAASSQDRDRLTSLRKCEPCRGSGLVYADRDRCRACNSGFVETIPNEPPPPYRSIP